MPSRLKGTLVAVIALMVIAGATVAMASNHDDVYYACLTPGGELSDVTVDEAPTCKGNKTLIQWNEAGQPGPPGPGSEVEFTRLLETFLGAPFTTAGQRFAGQVACPAGTSIVGGGVDVLGSFQKFVVSEAGMKYGGGFGGGQYEASITLIEDVPAGTRPTMNVVAVCVSGATVTDVFL